VPLLLNDASLAHSENSAHRWIGENYWAFYLAIGSSRLLGPLLSELIRFQNARLGRAFSLWSSLVCLSLFLTAVAYLVLPSGFLDGALVLLLAARIFAEAFKPVQAAYLNELILLRSMRAFTLSLATTLGSLVVSASAWALFVVGDPLTQAVSGMPALEAWSKPGRWIPVLLGVLALSGWLVLRRVNRSRPQAAEPARAAPVTTPLEARAPSRAASAPSTPGPRRFATRRAASAPGGRNPKVVAEIRPVHRKRSQSRAARTTPAVTTVRPATTRRPIGVKNF
jgi:hypothetical protein